MHILATAPAIAADEVTALVELEVELICAYCDISIGLADTGNPHMIRHFPNGEFTLVPVEEPVEEKEGQK